MLIGFSALVFMAACTGVSSNTASTPTAADDSDQSTYTSETVLATVNQVFNENESVVSISQLSQPTMKNFWDSLFPSAYATLTAACSSTRFTTCDSSAQHITYNGCTVDSGAYMMSGIWDLVFTGTGASTCLFPLSTGETVTRTVGSDVVKQNLNAGYSFKTTSADHTNYLNATIGGGIQFLRDSTASDPLSLTIVGLRRQGYSRKGVLLFDHSIKTSSAVLLKASTSRALGTREITGGVVVVDHNLSKFTATHTFSGASTVKWASSSCCYPTTGLLQVSVAPASGPTTTYDLVFSSTCGQATQYIPDQGSATESHTLTLRACE